MNPSMMLGLGTGPKAEASRQEFAGLLLAFAETTKERLSAMGIQTYEMVLFPKCTVEQVKQALFEMMQTHKFVPKPAEIIEYIEGQPERLAQVAWSKVRDAISEIGRYRSVVFDEPAIHAAIDGMGGWVKLCERLKLDTDYVRESNDADLFKEFKARYLAFNGQYPAMLIGAADQPKLEAKKNIRPEVYGDMEKARTVWSGGNQKLLLGKVSA